MVCDENFKQRNAILENKKLERGKRRSIPNISSTFNKEQKQRFRRRKKL